MGELPILWEDAIFAQKLIKQWIRTVLPLHSRPAIPATLVVGIWRADEAAARLWAKARLELAQSPGRGDTRWDTTARSFRQLCATVGVGRSRLLAGIYALGRSTRRRRSDNNPNIRTCLQPARAGASALARGAALGPLARRTLPAGPAWHLLLFGLPAQLSWQGTCRSS